MHVRCACCFQWLNNVSYSSEIVHSRFVSSLLYFYILFYIGGSWVFCTMLVIHGEKRAKTWCIAICWMQSWSMMPGKLQKCTDRWLDVCYCWKHTTHDQNLYHIYGYLSIPLKGFSDHFSYWLCMARLKVMTFWMDYWSFSCIMKMYVCRCASTWWEML